MQRRSLMLSLPMLSLEQLARFYSAESQHFENAVKLANIELN